MRKHIWLFFPKMFGPPPKKMERTTGYTKTSSPIPPFLNNNLGHENQLPTGNTLEHPHVTWGKNAKHSHLWVSFCKNCLDPAPEKNETIGIYKTKLVKLKNLCYFLRTRPGLRGKFAMTWRDEKQVEAKKNHTFSWCCGWFAGNYFAEDNFNANFLGRILWEYLLDDKS